MNLAIKLPDDLNERLLSFPLLQVLVKSLKIEIELNNKEIPEEEHQDLKVHLLAHKDDIDVLNLAPIKAFFHELDDEDLKSVFTAHRAVKNMKLDQVDVFISLTRSFVDASFGKSMGAKKRVGFSIGKNNIFFNEKVSLLKGRHHCEQYYEIIKSLVEEFPEELPKGYSRELEPLYSDWRDRPYSIINLTADKEGNINNEWEEFFSLIENERFVLICDELPLERQKEALSEFIKKQSPKNEYEIFELENNIEFGKLSAFAQTFVSFDSNLVNLAAYCGGHVHYMHKKISLDSTGPIHFLGDIRYFNLNEPFYKENGQIALHKIFDELIKFLEGKALGREE